MKKIIEMGGHLVEIETEEDGTIKNIKISENEVEVNKNEKTI